ncbi:MAG: type II secretion system F family protein [Candidatus Heimdallarchaeota archaeon]
MPKYKARTIRNIWILSVILFVVVVAFSLSAYVDLLQHMSDVLPEKDDPITKINEFTVIDTIDADVWKFNIDVTDATWLALTVLFAPAGFAYLREMRWRQGIDEHLPDLLREIGDAQKTGLPLPRAIKEASKHDYGPLTAELRKMAAKISWGISFQKGIQSLSDSAGTSLVKRASLLILEAERSGGTIEQVFESAYNHVTELLALRRERLGSMKPYTFIIYAAFLVFTLVVILLISTFFSQMAEQSVEMAGAEGAIEVPINFAGLQMVFFHMLMIEGSAAGIVAGKMGEGSAKAGLRHSFYLTTAGWLAFKVSFLLI